MQAIAYVRILTFGCVAQAVAAIVLLLVGEPWLAACLALTAALWGVLGVVTCRAFRKRQRATRSRQRRSQRLLRDIGSGHASVMVLSAPSAAELDALWNDGAPLRLVPKDTA